MPSRTHEGRQRLKRSEYERKGKEYHTIEEIIAGKDWTPCEHNCEWCYSSLESKRTPEKCARAAWRWFLKNKASEEYLATHLLLKKEKSRKENILRFRKKYKENTKDERNRSRRFKYIKPEVASRCDGRARLFKMAETNDGTITKDVYDKLIKEFEVCPYCGEPMKTSTLNLDHIVPLSKGGAHSKDNVIACCESCNSKKGSKSIHDWLMEVPNNRLKELKEILAARGIARHYTESLGSS
jgi:5-methylcytosine-specific restriction endonuclease McrA